MCWWYHANLFLWRFCITSTFTCKTSENRLPIKLHPHFHRVQGYCWYQKPPAKSGTTSHYMARRDTIALGLFASSYSMVMVLAALSLLQRGKGFTCFAYKREWSWRKPHKICHVKCKGRGKQVAGVPLVPMGPECSVSKESLCCSSLQVRSAETWLGCCRKAGKT